MAPAHGQKLLILAQQVVLVAGLQRQVILWRLKGSGRVCYRQPVLPCACSACIYLSCNQASKQPVIAPTLQKHCGLG